MKKSFTATGALLLSLALSGCALHAGHHHTQIPTLGAELGDLKLALERGAIDEQEYEELKESALRRDHSRSH